MSLALVLTDSSCVFGEKLEHCSSGRVRSTHHSVPDPEGQVLSYLPCFLFPYILLGLILTRELSLLRLHYRACFYSNWFVSHMSAGLGSEDRLRLIESKADGRASFPDSTSNARNSVRGPVLLAWSSARRTHRRGSGHLLFWFA